MQDQYASKKTTNRFYLTWVNLRRRCTDPKDKFFYKYGARGITYCDRWKSFDNYYSDMRQGYEPGLTLDRIDNDKGYSPDNCRWATQKVQSNNRSTNRRFTINGVSKTLAQWIETTSVKSSTVRQRYYGLGWSIEDSLFKLTRKRG